MASKASSEEKTKTKNSSVVDRLTYLLRAMKLNEDMMPAKLQSQYKCSRHTPQAPIDPNLLHSSSLIKRRDCSGGYGVDWTKDTCRVGGGIVPSPVSPVRHQGFKCGACWAVASVAAVETATRISSGPSVPLPPLSVQQILDCARNDGCGGGRDVEAYKYIIRNRGLASEKTYRYTEKNGTCDERRASQVVGGSIMAFEKVSPPTETALEEALRRGPVTAVIATDRDFDNYSGGIFRGACGAGFSHMVLVVGYGKDDDGTKYWKIQNSWGESWGEGGYMRMSYEAGKRCKLTQHAFYPIVNLLQADQP